MSQSSFTAYMKNGVPYEIHPCVEPGSQFSPEYLKEQIRDALKCMSIQSRWQRFASGVNELSESQLDYLTDLDGRNRIAWCAVVSRDDDYRGIGLARLIRLPDQSGIAEFAVTVIDEFQGLGVGRALLERLIESAGENGIRTLHGYVLPSNKAMLQLCRGLQASIVPEDSFMRADIQVLTQHKEPESNEPGD